MICDFDCFNCNFEDCINDELQISDYIVSEEITKFAKDNKLDNIQLAKKNYSKIYYKKHKEQIKARQKIYRELHKEEIKAYRKAYREIHKEEIKAYKKAYREKNKKSQIQSDK